MDSRRGGGGLNDQGELRNKLAKYIKFSDVLYNYYER